MDTSHLAQHAGTAGALFASIFVVATTTMRTMIPLRVFVILANVVLILTAIPTHNFLVMGVQAVMLHEAGFIGSRDILDGEAGFFRMAGSDRFRPDILVGGLQQDWQMLRGSFKVYPACRWIASAIEAFKLAFEESGLSMQDIEDIHVESFADVAEKLMSRVPVNAVDAQFCLPYLLGVVASGEPAGKAWFSPAALGRKDILEVAHLVRASVNADMDALMRGEERRPAAMVTVSGKGRSTMRYIDAPLGGELRPVSEAMVVQKAIENFGFSPSQSHDLADRYLSLGCCPDVHLLMVEFNSLMSNARS